MHRDTVITIGRQYGSGARSIAKELARQLDIPYYDKELLAIAAEQSGLSREVLEHRDEKPSETFYFSSWNMPMYHPELPLGQQIFLAQFHAIREVASRGGCVIVGRCADYVLNDHPHLVRVFLHAPLEARVQTIMARLSIDENEARKRIRLIEKNRSSYYNYFTDRKWGATETYDMCLSTHQASTQGIIDIIRDYAELRCPADA